MVGTAWEKVCVYVREKERKEERKNMCVWEREKRERDFIVEEDLVFHRQLTNPSGDRWDVLEKFVAKDLFNKKKKNCSTQKKRFVQHKTLPPFNNTKQFKD